MQEVNKTNALARLTEGIAELTSSDRWQDWLNMQSRFHHYSFGNVLLIAAQCPEASQVAGFRAWQRMNRFVRKGEKALWILAPMVYKPAEDESHTDDPNDRVIRGFKYVAVFDVSQTDGEELPSVCNRISGDDPTDLFSQLVTAAQSIGYTVEHTELDGEVNGDCTYSLHRIRVEQRNSKAQQVKTLAHEIAHALLHENFNDRRLAELEAESTAYVVCQTLGLETSGYSFGYVVTWAGDGAKAVANIKASCDRIAQAAERVLSALGVEAAAETAA